MGVTPGDQPERAAEIVSAYADAGCNWWVEDISPYGYGLAWDAYPWPADMAARLEERIRQLMEFEAQFRLDHPEDAAKNVVTLVKGPPPAGRPWWNAG